MNPKGATPIGNRFTTLSALHQFCPMLPIIWGDGKKIFRNPKSCPFKTKAKYPVPTTLKHQPLIDTTFDPPQFSMDITFKQFSPGAPHTVFYLLPDSRPGFPFETLINHCFYFLIKIRRSRLGVHINTSGKHLGYLRGALLQPIRQFLAVSLLCCHVGRQNNAKLFPIQGFSLDLMFALCTRQYYTEFS